MFILARTLRHPLERLGLPLIPHLGTARLVFTSTTVITLQQGIIPVVSGGGMWEAIPAGGITGSNTGLAANTTYFVYYAGAALYISTTGHSTDTDTGIEVMTGDVSKTLIGMIRTGAGAPGVFQAAPLTLTFFNRRSLSQRTNFTVDRTTASATYVELNTEIENNFLTWADEDVFAAIDGTMENSLVTNSNSTALAFDGAVAESGFEVQDINQAANFGIPCSVSGYKSGLAEGFHFATVLGATNGGTAKWRATTTVNGGAKVVLHIKVRG